MLWMAWRGADGRLQRRARVSCVKAAHLNGVADFQHFTATVLVQRCPEASPHAHRCLEAFHFLQCVCCGSATRLPAESTAPPRLTARRALRQARTQGVLRYKHTGRVCMHTGKGQGGAPRSLNSRRLTPS